MDQLTLFNRQLRRLVIESDISLACQFPEPNREINARCGLPLDETGHQFCARHKPMLMLDDGATIPCACPCHQAKPEKFALQPSPAVVDAQGREIRKRG